MLLRVDPRLVRSPKPGDYFAEEQVATWGLESFWGLPVYPSTPYYRTFESLASAERVERIPELRARAPKGRPGSRKP